MRVNGIEDPRRLRPGMRLKVPVEELRLEVSKTLYRLEVYLGDVLVRTHAVGLGKNDSTPEGSFVIATRQTNPIWFRDGERIPFGDPRNVLGTRWLGFENAPGLIGYGIHGTWEPDSIGKNESEGCVRMRNDEVEDLFELIPRGTPVTILP
jgi:lipoprotein-anchoring transpeptidase ErfK/SrfK